MKWVPFYREVVSQLLVDQTRSNYDWAAITTSPAFPSYLRMLYQSGVKTPDQAIRELKKGVAFFSTLK